MSIVDRFRRVLGLEPGTLHSVDEQAFEDALELPDGLPEQIRTVEQAALAIFKRHDLPTASVSYLRKGPDAPWEALPNGLTPKQKWALVNAAPEGAGWRYGERSVVGRRHPNEEVRNAATLLSTCDNLKRRLEGHDPVTPQDVADAMLLGTAAGVLMTAAQTLSEPLPPHVPLSFVAIEDDSKD